MTSRKVLHVLERFNVAGAEIVVRDLLYLFQDSDWLLSVCVLHDKGIIGTKMFEQGFPIYHIDWEGDALNDSGVTQRICHVIDDIRPDIIHAHNVTPWYFSVRASLGSWHLKKCATLHGFLTGQGVWKKKVLYSILSQMTKRIAIVSPRIKDQLCTIPFFPVKKVDVIPNGIRIGKAEKLDYTKKRAEVGIEEKDFIIGTVGRMYAEKNIEMQIRLIARLRKKYSNVKLVVVAKKYDYFKVLEELVESLGVQNQVIFTGLRHDVHELLRTFNLFLMTSLSEGTSMALLEAMAAECAVVASDVGGNGDIVKHKENGLLFNVQDLDQLEHCVISLINDHFYRRKLAKEAEKTAKNYDMFVMKKSYESFYKSILDIHDC